MKIITLIGLVGLECLVEAFKESLGRPMQIAILACIAVVAIIIATKNENK